MSDKPKTDDATGTKKPAGSDEAKPKPGEVGGPKGAEPTRYGDWQIKGRVSDF